MDTFRNWNRNFVCHPRERLRPVTVAEVVAIVRRARTEGLTVRPVGSGYSYTPLVATDGLMVDLSALNHVGPVDLEKRTVTVGSGIRLDRLTKALADQGAALDTGGDIDRQTLAGAISTGTHGSGWGRGSLSSQIVTLTVVDGTGAVIEIDGGDPQLLAASRIALGVLGLIVSVTLRVVPHHYLRVHRKPAAAEEALADIDGPLRANRSYEFFWYPRERTAFVRRWNEAPVSESTDGFYDKVQRFLGDVVLENLYVWSACALAHRWPRLRSLVFKAGWSLVPADTHVRPAESSYATPRLVHHHEIEYALPLSRAQEAMPALEELHRTLPADTLIPLQIRFVAAEDIPLSPSEGRDVMYVAAHTWWKDDYREYFRRCEEIFLALDGRPHWGKMHSLEAPQLKPRYRRWNEFQTARRQLDPDGIFLNDYLRRLLDPG